MFGLFQYLAAKHEAERIYHQYIVIKETDMTLPTESSARKALPITTGVLDYFPDALAAVAEVSRVGNDKHNPGEPLHWSRDKSSDHADCIARHLFERGTLDGEDGLRHSAKLAWRALALLQVEIENDRAGIASSGVVGCWNDGISDGWHVWNGGECPVSHDTLVDVVLRDGETINRAFARHLIWSHRSSSLIPEYEITRYRVSTQKESESRPGFSPTRLQP